jgi:hypothetical protein
MMPHPKHRNLIGFQPRELFIFAKTCHFDLHNPSHGDRDLGRHGDIFVHVMATNFDSILNLRMKLLDVNGIGFIAIFSIGREEGKRYFREFYARSRA